MHKLSKIATTFLLCSSISTQAAQVIGKIEIPSLTQTANNVSQFSKPISSTIPMIIAGGLIAASFDRKYAALDISSPLRACVFAEDGDLSPLWCFSIDKKGNPKKEYVKLAGTRLFYKENNERFILSESKTLLEGVSVLEKPRLNSSDISLELDPQSYMERCPAHFSRLKADIINKLSEGKSQEKLGEVQDQVASIEALLRATQSFNLSLSATETYLEINSLLKPAANTALETLVNQFSAQNLSLSFPAQDDNSGEVSLDKLALNIDLLLKMFASDKVVADKDMAIFAKIMKDSQGFLAFKDGHAVLNVKISQETVKQFIPEQYQQKSSGRQRIQF